MKRIIFIFIILFCLAGAGHVFAQEKIDNFDVEIKINSDAGIGGSW